MPSGRTHATASTYAAIATGGVVFVATVDPLAATLAALGCLSGILLSPDLDIESRTFSEYQVDRIFGVVVGWVWFAFWWPYARIIPHRNWMSHGYFVGTAIRLGWLYSAIWIPAALAGAVWSPPQSLWWWVLGLTVSDVLHTAMDKLSTWSKHRRL